MKLFNVQLCSILMCVISSALFLFSSGVEGHASPNNLLFSSPRDVMGSSFSCIGEFQLCPTSFDCVLIASECSLCPAQHYLCPPVVTQKNEEEKKENNKNDNKRECVLNFADCKGLTGTFWDHTLDIDTRVQLIINQTSTAEQIAQLTNAAPEIKHLYIPKYNWLNDDLHGLRRHSATSFPNGCGLGATWSQDTLEKVGDAIADEARALHHWYTNIGNRAENGYWNGLGLTLYAPNINLVRDPRWGRAQEVYSEDPYLTSELVKGYVAGVQQHQNGYLQAAACCKHFAVYDLESDPTLRYFYNAVVDGRNLWETYLPVFESCVKEAKAKHVMCSYNAINGVPACAQEPLLNGVLREKWNWQGFVVSDYDAWAQIYDTHKYCPNMTCAAAVGLNAGMDQEGGGTTAIDKLSDALKLGWVNTSRVAQAAARLFRVRLELGMFDPPTRVPYANISDFAISDEKHMALALQSARESICLYKNNDNVLPLANPQLREGGTKPVFRKQNVIKKGNKKVLSSSSPLKIAIVGPKAAGTSYLQGNYASPPSFGVVSLLEGILNTNCDASHAGQCVFDTPGVAYNTRNDTYMEVATAGECCNACSAYLGCNFFTFSQGKCYFSANSWSRRQTADTQSTIAGARPGMCLMEMNVTYATLTDPSFYVDDERECCQQCRVDPSCTLWTYSQVLRACFLNPTGRRNGSSPYTSSGTYPTSLKNSYVSYTPGCIDGLKCKNTSGFAKAAANAKSADAVLLVLGLDQSMESEGHDRSTIDLPDNQYQLASLLANITAAENDANSIPLIGIFVHGGTFAMKNLWTDLNAILDAWYPSQQGGNAIADVLFGIYTPAGRATVTYYRRNAILPPNLAVQDLYANATYHGLTYRYFNAGSSEVVVPFGHGLSYTSFAYSDLVLSPVPSGSTLPDACSEINVSVMVQNTGTTFTGDEVVQVYLKQLNTSVPAPNIRLASFSRLHEVQPGETRKAALRITPRFRTVIVEKNKADPILGNEARIEAGWVEIYVGGGQPGYKTGMLMGKVFIAKSKRLNEC